MKTRNLLILAVVVAVVGGYIFLHERHQMTTDELQERADRVFPELNTDDVQALEIRNSHGSFRIARVSDGWRLLEPIDFPADSAAVTSLLSSLESLEAERILDTAEVELAAYGLDDPQMTVAMDTGGGKSLSLSIGGEAALGSNRAFRRGEEQKIILGRGWFVTDLDKELDDWRSREVVTAPSAEVASVQVIAGDDRIQALRDGRSWKLIEPIEDLADSDHVENLITDLNGLRVDEFLDTSDLAGLGLDPPAYTVTLVRTEEAPPVRLEFGSAREKDGATHVACRRDGAEFFWVTDKAAVRLSKAPVLWRATKIRGFDTWDAERLTLESGDESLSLSRTEGLWQTDEGGEVDHAEVQDRLSRLASLEAVDFDLIQPGSEAMGKVELALSANDEGPQPVITYTVYPPLTEGGNAMVVVSDRATVMSVSYEAVNEILTDLNALIQPAQLEVGEGETG